MKLDEIRDEIKIVVQDGSFTDSEIDARVNDVFVQVCSRVMIPELKSIKTVTLKKGDYSVSLGSDFGGVLSRVIIDGDKSLRIFGTLDLLLDSYPDLSETGNVEAVAQEGSVLWYARSPAEDVPATVLYVAFPALLEEGGVHDEPVELPAFLHRDLLVYGVCALLFNLIEDGVDGAKTNTQVYSMLWEKGIVRLQEWLGRNRKHYISSVWRV